MFSDISNLKQNEVKCNHEEEKAILISLPSYN